METIKKSAEFQRVSRLGDKWVSSSFIVRLLNREDNNPARLGLIITKKVGNAVVRNRMKRRFRAIARLSDSLDKLQGHDIVLIGRNTAIERDFSLMEKDFKWCLKRLGIK